MTSLPDTLLLHQYRWMRAGLPLTIAASGLLLTLVAIWMLHPSWQKVEKWDAVQLSWLAGIAASCIAAAGVWLFRRWSLAQSAQRVDARVQAKNRLETATEFSRFDDPLLRAQREETAEFLRHTPVEKRLRRFPWLVLALALLVAGHFATLLIWTRPWLRPATVEKKAAEAPATPLPTASIKWKSPKAETKAAPIEEVPLEAVADSTGGLRELHLEVAVNGEKKLSAPVDVADLEKAGPRKIETSIYLDQLEVQPYDMISYHLRARRISDRTDIPETVSPVQFVQVKPFRDDVREMEGGGGLPQPEAESILRLIKALKIAQLRLLKENFTLAHAEIGRDHPDWQRENGRVGSEQRVLEEKAGKVLDAMIQAGAPAEMVNLIMQARPLIGDAAKKIGAAQNEPAIPVQGRALGLITEIEKFLVKAIARGEGGTPRRDIRDPFEKQRDVELKRRGETPAGELELLAREQARLADDLAQAQESADEPAAGTSENRITGTRSERQTQISQRVGALLNGQNFEPEIAEHLEKGRTQAREALRQLDADDREQAIEPAAGAARELRLAADAMKRAGEEKAGEQMAAALRVLNEAADKARTAPDQPSDRQAGDSAKKAAERAEQARRELAEAAQKQQETGSEESARRLAELAKALNDTKTRESLRRLRDQPRDRPRAEAAADRLGEIVKRMASERFAGRQSREDLENLIERMERTRANMERLAGQRSSAERNEKRGTPEKGQSPGNTPGASPGEGQRPGRDDGGSPSQPPEAGAAQASGTPGPEGQPGAAGGGRRGSGPAATTGGDSASREQLASQLIDELRDQIEEVSVALPSGVAELSHLRDALSRAPNREIPAGRQQQARLRSIYEDIRLPLDGMLDLLRAEIRQSMRKHLLKNQQADQAPPAYREAVADYFERLSRDYEKNYE